MKSEAHNTSQAKSTTKPSEERALKQATRQNKRKRQRRRGHRSFWRRWGWGIAAPLVLLLIGGAIFWVVRSQPAQIGDIPGVVTYSNVHQGHVNGKVNYAQNPPVGGPHNAVWQNCGIYSSPVANENAVHSMEHGAVWITYQPEQSSQAIDQLQALVRGHDHALLSPYPGLPAPVVASAWGVQLKVTSASDPRLAQFLQKYEKGPQTPEPGAPCSGGTGHPE